VYWPDGPDGGAQRHAPRANTAVVLDTDSVFHGVEPVGDGSATVPELAPGSELSADDGKWVLRDATGRALRSYDVDALRFSVSWKAYCFPDEAARDRWRDHTDDLDVDKIVDTLVDDLRDRGRVSEDVERDRELGLALIDEHVRFPVETP
jgi:hypothetical protein